MTVINDLDGLAAGAVSLDEMRAGATLLWEPPLLGDPDALAFLAAAAIVDPTLIVAVDTLVVDLKAAGLWAKMAAIYPFVGGTAATHRWNLRDPRDLDAAYRATFGAGWVHGPNGATGGSSPMNTHLDGSTLNATSSSWAFYSRTNTDGLASDYGTVSQVAEILTSLGGQMYHDLPSVGDRFAIVGPNTAGFFTGSLGAADVVLYRNGVAIGAKGSAVANAYAPDEMVFGSGYGNRYSNRQLAFAAIGSDDLDAGEAADLYAAVQTFQTALGRAV